MSQKKLLSVLTYTYIIFTHGERYLYVGVVIVKSKRRRSICLDRRKLLV